MALERITNLQFNIEFTEKDVWNIIEMTINGTKAEFLTKDTNKMMIAFIAIQDALQRNFGWITHQPTIDLIFRKAKYVMLNYEKGDILENAINIFESGAANENFNGVNNIHSIVTKR